MAQLDNKISSGDDLINNVLIKTSVEVVIQYLVFLINFSIQRGIFPKELAKAKFFPLHKGDCKLKENKYRPISLLNAWSKIYERVVFNRIYYYFESRQLLL